jgi:predicted kinase
MIHLIVGNTGAGKTTYSNSLKKEIDGVLFSLDFWNKTLFFPDRNENSDLDWMLSRIDRAETVMMDLILQLSEAGTDSILDVGLSKVSHRKKWIDFAEENDIEFRLHYLNYSKEIRFERIQKRNQERGETFEFEVSESDFEFMESWFEVLTAKELERAKVISL